MKEITNQPFSKLEIGSGYIYIGMIYRELKELGLANQYFESALHLCKFEKYFYSPDLKVILKCFVEHGQSEKASQWYNHLIERASYDKKFLKLKHLHIK